MRYKLILTALLVLFCCGAAPAWALTLAVFPIEDLSQGQNGVNEELTDYLGWQMDQRGFDVVAQDSVISFMARNRVRWLGFLDTRHIILAREELGADLVLFGTMSLRQEKLSPSFGLTLYLVRTEDTRTLWTGTGGLSQQDIVNLLGVGEREEAEGLLPRLAQNVLESWPEEFDTVAKQQHALEIESVELAPTHVRRGDQVECSVRLRTRWSEEDMPRVFFKVSGRVYMAKQSEDGFEYGADWQVAERDGRYPVTMVINWPSGHKKVAFLGAFSVDNAPPKLVLDLKGVRLEGTVAFRDQVIIIPRMLRREPVARWKLKVEDEAGEEQMSYTGYGQLPRRFVWNGRGKDGWPAEEGIYRVTLQVWDRADNLAIATQPVAVARTPPSMVLEAKNQGREMIVDLDAEGKVPIAFWRMEMRSDTGEVIKVAEGNQLPFRMDVAIPHKVIKVADRLVPPAAGKNVVKVAEADPLIMDVSRPEDKETRKVEVTVIMRDILGNLTRERISDISEYAAQKEIERQAEEEPPVWLDEF